MNLGAKSRRIKDALFNNSSMRQTVFKNTFWLTVSNFMGRIIRGVLLIYVARVLGADGYGAFSYAVGLAALFSIFSDIGVNGMLTREGARDPQAFPDLLSTALVLKIILLAITNVLLFSAVPFSHELRESASLLPWAALLIVFDGMRDLTFSITRSHEKMQTEAAINIATNLAITAFGIVLVFLHPTPRALVAGYAVGSGVGTVLAYILLKDYFSGWWRRVKPRLMIPVLKEGFLFGMMGLMGTLMLNTDTVMIRHFLSNAELGLYSAAQRPIQILYIFPGIISTVLFPAFSRFASTDRKKFVSLLEQAVAFTILIALPLFLGGLALRDQLILTLFGEGYRGAVTSFYLLLSTILFTFPGIFIGNAIFAINKQRVFAVLLALGTLGNAFFNYLLIPRYGIVGSSISTIIAQVLANGFTWWALRREVPFHTVRHLGKIFFASVVMAGATYFFTRLGLALVFNMLLAFVIYFGLLYLTREKLLAHFNPRSFFPRKLAPASAEAITAENVLG